MTKLLATVAILKGILIAASVALARGDASAVVLVSALLSLVQFGTKPATHLMSRRTAVASSSQDHNGQAIR